MKPLLTGPLLLTVLMWAGVPAAAQDEFPPQHKSHHHKTRDHATPASDDDATAAAEESQHVVRAGETLGGVAARAKVPRILIAEANG